MDSRWKQFHRTVCWKNYKILFLEILADKKKDSTRILEVCEKERLFLFFRFMRQLFGWLYSAPAIASSALWLFNFPNEISFLFTQAHRIGGPLLVEIQVHLKPAILIEWFRKKSERFEIASCYNARPSAYSLK